jgi:hypothetical protein
VVGLGSVAEKIALGAFGSFAVSRQARGRLAIAPRCELGLDEDVEVEHIARLGG